MGNLNDIITNMVDSSSYDGATTTAVPQEDLEKLLHAPIRLTPAINPQQGWQCPVCGAVMSPWTSVCVNCHGNTPQVTFYQETCTGSGQASCRQTITTTSHT